MKNIYFDICSIPIFILILWTCRSRKMTRGRLNQVFILLNIISLACAALDLGMELSAYPTPLSREAVARASALLYAYLALRNATIVVYLIFLFIVTRTTHRLRGKWRKLLLVAPYGLSLIALLQNPANHNVFTITLENGYARGPLMGLLYGVSAWYGLAGTAYCVYCKRFLPTGKWLSLLSIYAMTFAAVLVQLLRPTWMVELFFTAIALLMVMLLVMRPEETIDANVGVQSWRAYQTDLRNTLMSGQPVQVVVIQMTNAMEIRTYLGEDTYYEYLREIVDELRRLHRRELRHIEMYFERPGFLYLILEDMGVDAAALAPIFLERVRERVRKYADMGVRFEPRICAIRCPEDLSAATDIINLGHKFTNLCPPEQAIVRAAEIVKSRDFDIVNHMEEILNRAIMEDSLEMYYQPIYDIKARKFRSAEALARLIDAKYGMISPAIFIPAAESAGLILAIGDIVLESVFRFISQHDLKALGLDYIEINLSVAQCLQADLPENISRLQAKYGVDPGQVNFEITETVFGDLSSVMGRNLRVLSGMGYGFSLDDYGVGYSNIQRLSRLPLRIIKIDKSLVDEMFSNSGRVIIRNTVSMMQGIHKELVMEGVETEDAVKACRELSCDFIQGFYFSKPLPAAEFVKFLEENNRGGAVA